MDPFKRGYSRRSLLPVEKQIIDALGLTLDEYWHFCRLADCAAKERGPEYKLIPEVNASGLEPWVVSLLIGVGTTAASVLLAPKPPKPEQQLAGIKTADVRGQTKFAELFGFDSLQDLAALGSIIPLVFTRQITNPADSDKVFGGVRVKAMLLWSQLLSRGTHQELKMLGTLGLSSLTSPDSEGLAVGDQLLRSYQDSRYKAYFRNNQATLTNSEKGGRIKESDAIANAGSLPPLEHDDVFEAYDRIPDTFEGLFCGARTPSSQTTFGCHNPIPSGVLYYLPYDIVQNMKDSRGNILGKREKINTPYSGRMAMNELHRPGASLTEASNPDVHVPVDMEQNDELVFTIVENREDPDRFAPHGLTDVNSAIDQRAIDADTKIAVGDLFLFGTALLKCQYIRSDDPWEVIGKRRDTKQFEFKCLEPGFAALAHPNATPAGSIPYYNTQLQEVSIGTVTNNRKCHQTEIGIKSTVFKRVDNFANVQSEPDFATQQEFERDKQPFSLGRVSAFQTRYSFFRLEVKDVTASASTAFRNVMPGQFFAVKGSNSQPQYNTIRINHPFGEYEFRLMPVPGAVFSNLYNYDTIDVHLFQGKGRGEITNQGGPFLVTYTGSRVTLTRNNVSNVQFEFQSIENQTILVSGIVEEFTKEGTDLLIGEDPVESNFEIKDTRVDYNDAAADLNYGVLVNVNNPTINGATYAAWGGVLKTLEIIETDGYVYRKGSTKIRTIPVIPRTWQSTQELPFVFAGTPTSNHNYVKFGATSQATEVIVGGNPVSLDLFENPGLQNFNAIYRQGSQSQRVDDVPNPPIRVVADAPDNNGELYEAFAFYVIEFDGGGFSARWAAEPVTVGLEPTEANPIQYRKGAVKEYRDDVQQFEVFPIYRLLYQEPTPQLLASVEVGSYGAGNEVPRDLFEIEQYEKFEQRPFVAGGAPADYDLSGGSGTGLKINASSFAPGKWQWQVRNGGSNYKQGDVLSHTFGDGTEVSIEIKSVREQTVEVPGREHLNPLDAIADFPKYELEKTSHQDGPEHVVTFVNELVRPGTDTNLVPVRVQYDDLSLLGLRVLAGRDWTSMGQLTAYIKQGIKVERLINDAGGDLDAPLTASTNNFAEIAYNLLVNKRIGAGKKIPVETVDRNAMIVAAKFCHANGFTYDGVIEDKIALREFIHQTAALNLLDFKIVGGKFSLEPSVPYNSASYQIEHTQDINTQVKALFTDGNIKDMQVNFLTPQERQLTQMVVSYREEEPNGFSEQKTIRLRFKNEFGGSDTDPEDAIDLTSFCTNRFHAQTIAQYTLTTRKHTDHTIRFKTTPSSAMALGAGDYIKVISNATHTSRFYNGSVDGEGNITATSELIDAPNYEIFYWKPRSGEQNVIEGIMPVAGMKTGDETFFNSIFTLKMKNELKRVYRIDSLTVDEEGYVDVTGTHQPLLPTGSLATINLDPSQFLPGSDDRD